MAREVTRLGVTKLQKEELDENILIEFRPSNHKSHFIGVNGLKNSTFKPSIKLFTRQEEISYEIIFYLKPNNEIYIINDIISPEDAVLYSLDVATVHKNIMYNLEMLGSVSSVHD